MRPRVSIILAAAALLTSSLSIALPATASSAATPASAAAVSGTSKNVVVASDSFSRNAIQGWGMAPFGSAYKFNDHNAFADSGGHGQVTLGKPGHTEVATVGHVSVRDTQVSVLIAVGTVPTSGAGTYNSVLVRSAGGHAYRASLRIAPGGIGYLYLARIDGSSRAVSNLAAPFELRQRMVAGAYYNLVLWVSGDSKVTLRAKTWRSGAAVPGWQLQFSDSTAKRLANAGSVQLTSISSVPAEVRYDNLKIIRLATPVKVVLPPITVPAAPVVIKPAPISPAAPKPTTPKPTAPKPTTVAKPTVPAGTPTPTSAAPVPTVTPVASVPTMTPVASVPAAATPTVTTPPTTTSPAITPPAITPTPPATTLPAITPPATTLPSITPLPEVTLPVITVPTVTPPIAIQPANPAPPALVVTASVSSASNVDGAGAVTDGSVQAGQTGAEWVAVATDAAPWAQLNFSAARNLASVQVFGPSTNWVNPKGTANAPEYGNLLFSDGSTVVVSGIAGGIGAATTIAFAPRSVTWVRISLLKTDPQVKFGLREFAAYDTGTTPPRWPTNAGAAYSVPLQTAGICSASSAPVGSTTGASLALVCPAAGTAVVGLTTVVVAAPPASLLTASAWLPEANAGMGGVVVVGSAVSDLNGRATFLINAALMTDGPTALRIAIGTVSATPLYVQLNNVGGQPLASGDTAPSGMTLQWNDNFSAPVSISRTGAGADYGASKPAYWGTSEFGEAVFADPAKGLNTIDTVDDNYLRIRAQPTTVDPQGWGRTHAGGMVSSLKVGASGFSAQYGYFEARILAPAGAGSWPAFWMMNTEAATNRNQASSEVDAVELYGQNTAGSCHSLHSWKAAGTSAVYCPSSNGASDWALSWHTYAARVSPNQIDYYIDNQLVKTITGPILTNQPFYFMLNLALGGGWPVNLTPTGDTIDMYVDWVRVYT